MDQDKKKNIKKKIKQEKISSTKNLQKSSEENFLSDMKTPTKSLQQDQQIQDIPPTKSDKFSSQRQPRTFQPINRPITVQKRDINQLQFVIVDIQTTGLNPQVDKITEIAAILLQNGIIIDTYHTLVNPQKVISQQNSKLTGINNQMVKQAPKISQVLPSFLEFIGDNIFVAHNAQFDYKFISRNCHRQLKRWFLNKTLCTKKLSINLFPDLELKSLSSLCKHFNIQNKEAHRAMSDALVTVQIFQQFLKILEKQNIIQNKDIIQFSRTDFTDF